MAFEEEKCDNFNMTETITERTRQILAGLDISSYPRISDDVAKQGIENERQAIAIMENEGFEIGPEVLEVAKFIRDNRLSQEAAGRIGLEVATQLYVAISGISRDTA